MNKHHRTRVCGACCVQFRLSCHGLDLSWIGDLDSLGASQANQSLLLADSHHYQ